MLDKLKSRLKEAGEIAKAKSTALLPEDWIVPESISEERLNICKTCEHLYQRTNQCRLCACFMNAKTKLAAAKCPINKWEKHGKYKDSADA